MVQITHPNIHKWFLLSSQVKQYMDLSGYHETNTSHLKNMASEVTESHLQNTEFSGENSLVSGKVPSQTLETNFGSTKGPP